MTKPSHGVNPPSTESTRSSLCPLPPDVHAVHKARINRELIQLTRLPADGKTSIQGIGLYTHVAAPQAPGADNNQQIPVFLPVNDIKKAAREHHHHHHQDACSSSVSQQVRQVWHELRHVINEEERHLGHDTTMTAQKLQDRYTALHVAHGQDPSQHATQLHNMQLGRMLDYVRHLQQRQLDKSDAAPRGNEYHEARDPRRR
ncbi:hypothetical protein ACEQ8H_006320 [Pleosporales sp. CAS-2024a]